MDWQEVLLLFLAIVRAAISDVHVPHLLRHHPRLTLSSGGHHIDRPNPYVSGREPLHHAVSGLGTPPHHTSGPNTQRDVHFPQHPPVGETYHGWSHETEELGKSVHQPSERVSAYHSSKSPPSSSYRSPLGLSRDEDPYVDIHQPPVSFEYEVHNDETDTHFGHSEVRQGDTARGNYFVQLPDRRMQTVSYVADEKGFVPNVAYKSADYQSYQTMISPGTKMSHDELRRELDQLKHSVVGNTWHNRHQEPHKHTGGDHALKTKHQLPKSYGDARHDVQNAVKSSYKPLSTSHDSHNHPHTPSVPIHQRPKYVTDFSELSYDTARRTSLQKHSQGLGDQVYSTASHKPKVAKTAYSSLENHQDNSARPTYQAQKSILSYSDDTFDIERLKYTPSPGFSHDNKEDISYKPSKLPFKIGEPVRLLSQEFGAKSQQRLATSRHRPVSHSIDTHDSRPQHGPHAPLISKHGLEPASSQPIHNHQRGPSHRRKPIHPAHTTQDIVYAKPTLETNRLTHRDSYSNTLETLRDFSKTRIIGSNVHAIDSSGKLLNFDMAKTLFRTPNTLIDQPSFRPANIDLEEVALSGPLKIDLSETFFRPPKPPTQEVGHH